MSGRRGGASVWYEKKGRDRYLVRWRRHVRSHIKGRSVLTVINESKLCVGAENRDDFIHSKKQELNRQDLGLDASPSVHTWSELAEAHEKTCRLSPKKLGVFLRFDRPAIADFTAFFKDGPLQAILPSMGQGYIDFLWAQGWHKKGRGPRFEFSPTTVGMRVRHIKAILGGAVGRGWLVRNPFQGLKPPKSRKRGRALPVPLINKILEHPICTEYPELQQIIIFSIECGPRLDECLKQLRHERIERPRRGPWYWDTGRIRKNGEPALVPIATRDAKQAIGPAKPSGVVFSMGRRMVQKRLTAIGKSLGFDLFHHLFRHTFATHYLSYVGSPEDLKEMGLWKDEKALREYYHPRKEALAAKMSRMKYRGLNVPPPAHQKENGDQPES